MFDEELGYFVQHQNELVSLHRGKTLAIRGREIVGVYASPLEAYLETQKRFALGTFMIQPCEPGPEAYSVTISSHGLFGSRVR